MNPDKPAFPQFDNGTGITFLGLTKRELFVAMAMQGLLAQPEAGGGWIAGGVPMTLPEIAADICRTSAAYADALIAELSKPKGDA